MQYNKNEYTVKINRGSLYTSMTITNRKGEQVYHNQFLPVCKTRIEAENNAERIANQYTI